MRHLSICPIRSPGPTIAQRTPERIGQTTRTSRKNSAKEMCLICRGRIIVEVIAPAPAGTPGKVFSPERAVSTSLLLNAGLCSRLHPTFTLFLDRSAFELFRCPTIRGPPLAGAGTTSLSRPHPRLYENRPWPGEVILGLSFRRCQPYLVRNRRDFTPNDSGTRGFVPVVDFIPGQEDDLSIAAQDQILKSWQISRASGQVREADPPTSKDLLRLLAIHCPLVDIT